MTEAKATKKLSKARNLQREAERKAWYWESTYRDAVVRYEAAIELLKAELRQYTGTVNLNPSSIIDNHLETYIHFRNALQEKRKSLEPLSSN